MTTMTKDSRVEHERMERASGSRYWIVWIVLLVLTIMTYIVWRLHLPEPFHFGAAMVIACAKSALVVLFFMHLWDHGGANRIVFVTSVFFVALLIGLVVLDNASRFQLTNPARGELLKLEPPGPDILSPRVYPPEPGRRTDAPTVTRPGRDVPTAPAGH